MKEEFLFKVIVQSFLHSKGGKGQWRNLCFFFLLFSGLLTIKSKTPEPTL